MLIFARDYNIDAPNGTLRAYCLADATEITIFGIYNSYPALCDNNTTAVTGGDTQPTAVT